jgi:alkylation response protein AidB-like acyl-CoA dehydrogenase
VIAEELGRAVAPIPFASTVYFLAEALMLAGSEEQKQDLLPKIAAGEVIGCLATSEGPGVVNASNLQATVSDGNLHGVKIPVTDGDIATLALVLAKENGKTGLYLVDLTGGGVSREVVKTLDPTRDAAKLTFKDAPARRLGPAGEGFELLEQILDRAAVLLAFEQCGGADRCLELAKEYALERYAFGRVIASYQAIKHKLADMYVKNELARSNAYYGAWALNTNAPELPVAASAARISASEAFWFAAKENIQTHGGIGFTWEMDCHLFYRRSRQLSLVAARRGSGRNASSATSSAATRKPPERDRNHGFQRHPRRSRLSQTGPGLARRQRAQAGRRRRPRGRRRPGGGQGLAGQEGRGRLRLHHLAQGMGRAGRHTGAERDLLPGGGQVSRPLQSVPDRPGHVRADGHDLRRRRDEEAVRRPGDPG